MPNCGTSVYTFDVYSGLLYFALVGENSDRSTLSWNMALYERYI